MLKSTIYLVLICIITIFSGCSKSDGEGIKFDLENPKLGETTPEQQEKINEFDKSQNELLKAEEEKNGQEELTKCENIKKNCKLKIVAIGTEEIEIFNDNGTSWGKIRGDRTKAIESCKDEIKKDKKYIDEKKSELDDYSKGGDIYDVIKRSIERKKDNIDRNEKIIKKVEALIVTEKNQKNALLTDECKDYEIPCE
ncbi:MAG: hypothetical protein WC819_05530 [Parcubacteria group bacterium]|jgi:hypothetical protein